MSHVKKCELCGNEFVAKRVSQKYCSKNCCRTNWSRNNPEKCKESRKKDWLKNRNKRNEANKKRWLKNRNKYSESQKKWKLINNDRRKEMDFYLVGLLKQQGVTNPTPEQIEQKRLAIKIKRKINEIQRQINPH